MAGTGAGGLHLVTALYSRINVSIATGRASCLLVGDAGTMVDTPRAT